MFSFIDNAATVAKYSWSIKGNLIGALLSGLAFSLPLWDPAQQWFSTTNVLFIGTLLSNVGAGFLRLVDQGLTKPQRDEDPDGQIPLGI